MTETTGFDAPSGVGVDAVVSHDDLREMATEACKKANGRDWESMFSGEQDAQIEAWMEGYAVGSKRPYLRIMQEGCGSDCEAGETIRIPDPRLEWLWKMYEKAKEEGYGAEDEIKHFYDWVSEKLSG